MAVNESLIARLEEQTRLLEDANRALREQQQLLENAQRIGRMGSWHLDVPSGRLVWSDATCDLFGITQAEFRGTFEHFYSFILPDDRPAYHAVHARIHPGATHLETEFRIRRPDGAVRWMYSRGDVEFGPSGEQVRRLGMIMDVTDLHEARARLAENASLLRIAGRAAQIGGWRIELPARVMTWSDEICDLHEVPRGYQPTLAEGLSFYTPESRPVIERHLEACIRNGTPYDIEVEKITATGRRIIVRTMGEAVRDTDGTIVCVQGAFQDITEQRELQARLFRSQRMESIGTLAGGIAHDLNNVLTPILMAIDLLRDDDTPAERAETIATIREAAIKGAEMVRQVLSFARGVDGRRVEVDVERLVREVAKICDDTFLKSIDIHTTIAPPLPAVVGDPTQLHQVLLNLCVNARDAMPDGGAITMTARRRDVDETAAAAMPDARPGAYLVIEVTDTGHGMTPDVAERIFEPFFTTKEPGKGTGLGLSTSLAIVRSHGGFFQVRSAPDAGATFRVHLPVSGGTSPAADAAEQRARLRGAGETILVVDDEGPVREMTRRMLETSGYRALIAAGGAQGVEMFHHQRADIAAVITDMMMPVMNGAAVIRAIRAIDPGARVLAVSGLGDALELPDESASPARSRPIHRLQKPYSTDEILRALHAVLHDGR